MKRITFDYRISLEDAYDFLQEKSRFYNEVCVGKFNEFDLLSTDTFEEICLKATGRIQKRKEQIKREQARAFFDKEWERLISHLISEFQKEARKIISDEYLEEWNSVLLANIKSTCQGRDLEDLLKIVSILNEESIAKENRFEQCFNCFQNQNCEGSRSLILENLEKLHKLGGEAIDYILKRWSTS